MAGYGFGKWCSAEQEWECITKVLTKLEDNDQLHFEDLFSYLSTVSSSEIKKCCNSLTVSQKLDFFKNRPKYFIIHDNYVSKAVSFDSLTVQARKKFFSSARFILQCFGSVHYLEIKKAVTFVLEDVAYYMLKLLPEEEKELLKNIRNVAIDDSGVFTLTTSRKVGTKRVSSEEKCLLAVVYYLGLHGRTHFKKLLEELESFATKDYDVVFSKSSDFDCLTWLKKHEDYFQVHQDNFVSLYEEYSSYKCDYQKLKSEQIPLRNEPKCDNSCYLSKTEQILTSENKLTDQDNTVASNRSMCKKFYISATYLTSCFNPLHYLEIKECIFFIMQDVARILKRLSLLRLQKIFEKVPFTSMDENGFLHFREDCNFDTTFVTKEELVNLFVVYYLGFCGKTHFEKVIVELMRRAPDIVSNSISQLPAEDQLKYFKQFPQYFDVSNKGELDVNGSFALPYLEYKNDTFADSETSCEDCCVSSNKCSVIERMYSSIAFLLNFFELKLTCHPLRVIFLVLNDVKSHFLNLSALDQVNFIKEIFSPFTIDQRGTISSSRNQIEIKHLTEKEMEYIYFACLVSDSGRLHYRQAINKYIEDTGKTPKNTNSDSMKFRYFKAAVGIFQICSDGYITLCHLPKLNVSTSFLSEILNISKVTDPKLCLDQLFQKKGSLVDPSSFKGSSNVSQESNTKGNVSYFSAAEYKKLCEAVSFLLTHFKSLYYITLKKIISLVLTNDVGNFLKELTLEEQDEVFKSIPRTCMDQDGYMYLTSSSGLHSFVSRNKKQCLFIVGFLAVNGVTHYTTILNELLNYKLCVGNLTSHQFYNFLGKFPKYFTRISNGYVCLSNSFALLDVNLGYCINPVPPNTYQNIQLQTTSVHQNKFQFDFDKVCDNLTHLTLSPLSRSVETQASSPLENAKSNCFSSNSVIKNEKPSKSGHPLYKKIQDGLLYLLQYFTLNVNSKFLRVLFLVLDDYEIFHYSSTYDKISLLKKSLSFFKVDEDGVISVLSCNTFCKSCLVEGEKEELLLSFIVFEQKEIHFLKIFNELSKYDVVLCQNTLDTSAKFRYFKERKDIFYIGNDGYVTLLDWPSIDLELSVLLQCFSLADDTNLVTSKKGYKGDITEEKCQVDQCSNLSSASTHSESICENKTKDEGDKILVTSKNDCQSDITEEECQIDQFSNLPSTSAQSGSVCKNKTEENEGDKILATSKNDCQSAITEEECKVDQCFNLPSASTHTGSISENKTKENEGVKILVPSKNDCQSDITEKECQIDQFSNLPSSTQSGSVCKNKTEEDEGDKILVTSKNDCQSDITEEECQIDQFSNLPSTSAQSGSVCRNKTEEDGGDKILATSKNDCQSAITEEECQVDQCFNLPSASTHTGSISENKTKENEGVKILVTSKNYCQSVITKKECQIGQFSNLPSSSTQSRSVCKNKTEKDEGDKILVTSKNDCQSDITEEECQVDQCSNLPSTSAQSGSVYKKTIEDENNKIIVTSINDCLTDINEEVDQCLKLPSTSAQSGSVSGGKAKDQVDTILDAGETRQSTVSEQLDKCNIETENIKILAEKEKVGNKNGELVAETSKFNPNHFSPNRGWFTIKNRQPQKEADDIEFSCIGKVRLKKVPSPVTYITKNSCKIVEKSKLIENQESENTATFSKFNPSMFIPNKDWFSSKNEPNNAEENDFKVKSVKKPLNRMKCTNSLINSTKIEHFNFIDSDAIEKAETDVKLSVPTMKMFSSTDTHLKEARILETVDTFETLLSRNLPCHKNVLEILTELVLTLLSVLKYYHQKVNCFLIYVVFQVMDDIRMDFFLLPKDDQAYILSQVFEIFFTSNKGLDGLDRSLLGTYRLTEEKENLLIVACILSRQKKMNYLELFKKCEALKKGFSSCIMTDSDKYEYLKKRCDIFSLESQDVKLGPFLNMKLKSQIQEAYLKVWRNINSRKASNQQPVMKNIKELSGNNLQASSSSTQLKPSKFNRKQEDHDKASISKNEPSFLRLAVELRITKDFSWPKNLFDIYGQLNSSVTFLQKYFDVRLHWRIVCLVFQVLNEIKNKFILLSKEDQMNILKNVFGYFSLKNKTCDFNEIYLVNYPLNEEQENLLLLAYIISCEEDKKLHYLKLFAKFGTVKKKIPIYLQTVSDQYNYINRRDNLFSLEEELVKLLPFPSFELKRRVRDADLKIGTIINNCEKNRKSGNERREVFKNDLQLCSSTVKLDLSDLSRTVDKLTEPETLSEANKIFSLVSKFESPTLKDVVDKDNKLFNKRFDMSEGKVLENDLQTCRSAVKLDISNLNCIADKLTGPETLIKTSKVSASVTKFKLKNVADKDDYFFTKRCDINEEKEIGNDLQARSSAFKLDLSNLGDIADKLNVSENLIDSSPMAEFKISKLNMGDKLLKSYTNHENKPQTLSTTTQLPHLMSNIKKEKVDKSTCTHEEISNVKLQAPMTLTKLKSPVIHSDQDVIKEKWENIMSKQSSCSIAELELQVSELVETVENANVSPSLKQVIHTFASKIHARKQEHLRLISQIRMYKSRALKTERALKKLEEKNSLKNKIPSEDIPQTSVSTADNEASKLSVQKEFDEISSTAEASKLGDRKKFELSSTIRKKKQAKRKSSNLTVTNDDKMLDSEKKSCELLNVNSELRLIENTASQVSSSLLESNVQVCNKDVGEDLENQIEELSSIKNKENDLKNKPQKSVISKTKLKTIELNNKEKADESLLVNNKKVSNKKESQCNSLVPELKSISPNTVEKQVAPSLFTNKTAAVPENKSSNETEVSESICSEEKHTGFKNTDDIVSDTSEVTENHSVKIAVMSNDSKHVCLEEKDNGFKNPNDIASDASEVTESDFVIITDVSKDTSSVDKEYLSKLCKRIQSGIAHLLKYFRLTAENLLLKVLFHTLDSKKVFIKLPSDEKIDFLQKCFQNFQLDEKGGIVLSSSNNESKMVKLKHEEKILLSVTCIMSRWKELHHRKIFQQLQIQMSAPTDKEQFNFFRKRSDLFSIANDGYVKLCNFPDIEVNSTIFSGFFEAKTTVKNEKSKQKPSIQDSVSLVSGTVTHEKEEVNCPGNETLNLKVASKTEDQNLCFVPSESHSVKDASSKKFKMYDMSKKVKDSVYFLLNYFKLVSEPHLVCVILHALKDVRSYFLNLRAFDQDNFVKESLRSFRTDSNGQITKVFYLTLQFNLSNTEKDLLFLCFILGQVNEMHYQEVFVKFAHYQRVKPTSVVSPLDMQKYFSKNQDLFSVNSGGYVRLNLQFAVGQNSHILPISSISTNSNILKSPLLNSAAFKKIQITQKSQVSEVQPSEVNNKSVQPNALDHSSSLELQFERFKESVAYLQSQFDCFTSDCSEVIVLHILNDLQNLDPSERKRLLSMSDVDANNYTRASKSKLKEDEKDLLVITSTLVQFGPLHYSKLCELLKKQNRESLKSFKELELYHYILQQSKYFCISSQGIVSCNANSNPDVENYNHFSPASEEYFKISLSKNISTENDSCSNEIIDSLIKDMDSDKQKSKPTRTSRKILHKQTFNFLEVISEEDSNNVSSSDPTPKKFSLTKFPDATKTRLEQQSVYFFATLLSDVKMANSLKEYFYLASKDIQYHIKDCYDDNINYFLDIHQMNISSF